MLNCLLSIALTLVSLAALSACTAANAPGQGGISIPNLITSPAQNSVDGDGDEADYVYVDSIDPDVPGTTDQSPRVILAAGRTRGSVRLASTGELLAAVPFPATRFALVDLNADNVRDLVVLNGSAASTEYGLRAFDMKKLIAQKELVDLNLNFPGPVYAVAEYGTKLLLALGTEVAEVTKAMAVVQRRTSIPAKDVFRLHVKVASGSRVPQFGFHTTNDCGAYSFCLEIYSDTMGAITNGRLSTNAQPGKHLSVFTDDINEDGIIEGLCLADNDRTSELAFSGNNPFLRNLTSPAPSSSDISSTTISAKNMWNRSGAPRDLLVTVPAEAGGATALIYREKVTGSTATSTFELDTVFSWTLGKLRSALVKTVFNDDDLLLMESDSIHALEGSINADGDLEFTARYSITD